MDTKHGHVEGNWDDNQTEDSGHEMLGKKALYWLANDFLRI